MNSRLKELFSNTLLFAIANMGSKILVFLMVPLYTAVLTTEEYGISDMVQTTSSLLYPILTVMISEAVLRFCFLKQFDIKKVFSIGFRITIFGVIFCVLFSIVFYFIPFFQSIGKYVFFIPLLFFSNSLVQLLHKFSRGIDKVKVSAGAGLLSTVVAISLNLIFLLVLKIGVVGYLLSFILANMSAIIYMSIKCDAKNYFEKPKDALLRKQMLSYSIPLVPNSLSWWALDCVNRYIMMAWIGISAVGIYSATLRIPTILTVLSDIFAQAWLLSALKDYGSEESKRFILSMHNRFFSILVVMTGVIILLSKFLANILLTGEFSSYWSLIPFLFISVFWGALVGFIGSIFSAERKNTMQFVSTVVGALVSVLITVLFLKRYGVLVVAIATMVAYYVIWLIRRLAVNKYLKIGYGFLYSSFQGLVLLAEAVFVGKELYTLSIICLLLLVCMNYKILWQIIMFGYDEVLSKIRFK